MKRPHDTRTGFVYLVGAGPGDPELLTLKAVKALRKADVVLCDDLVDEEVLEYARPCARIVHVGKRGGRASTSQAFIERLMISEAVHGAIVVRLKGGDPFIFGRGGEECDALRNAGIAFEVVNGITAGLAAAGAIGVPLTRRGLSRGVVLVTGHEASPSLAGKAPDEGSTDWAALARTGMTLVIYMGIARCDEIGRGLMKAGMAAATPVAIVRDATRRGQASIATRLDRMASDIARAGIGSPAVMIVGEVAAAAALVQGLAVPQGAASPLRRRTAMVSGSVR
ncbi:MAG TPA: uroporphyrinogen-III C-methyltransferase [Usitatibacter sp.]|jgi:uroporphyrin-III C-methyltransferase|nr:uroporphyrinogen-III C-methyltransferase [Usitatibacter sp.]